MSKQSEFESKILEAYNGQTFSGHQEAEKWLIRHTITLFLQRAREKAVDIDNHNRGIMLDDLELIAAEVEG